MIRVFSPGRAMEMATYERAANGTWSQASGVERAFGLAATTSNPNQYTHHWLMTEGLIRPDSLNSTRKVVIKTLNDPTYGPAEWGTEVIALEPWVARQRTNWTTLEGLPPEDGIACEWVKSNVSDFDHKPDLATQTPMFPPAHGPEPRQIDVGSVGVFFGDDETGVHVGELFVSASGLSRSEIWVLSQTYDSHVPPGTSVNDTAHWITLGPTVTFASSPPESRQDFLDRAWAGVPNAAGVTLVSATTYNSIPAGGGA